MLETTLPTRTGLFDLLHNDHLLIDSLPISIISALTNAFISQRLENSTNTVHIPLVAVPREEYELRPETNMLLSSLSINMSSIPSFADLTRNASFYRSLLARQGSVVFTLLDHNSPTERFRQLFPFPSYQVSAILDHHQDMGDLLDVCSGECREIAFDSAGMRALVASTCTLVAERVLDRPPFLEPAALKEVVSLLYGVILIDSLNMDPRVQKGTPRDQRVLDRIAAQVLPQYQNDSQRATFFQSLAEAKTNLTFWRGVSLLNCLRYDYKLFFGPVRAERIGFSSVLLPIAWLLEKLEANAASSSVDPLGGLRDFYFRDQQLDLLVVLAFAEGRREILVLTARQSEELLSTGSAPRGATLLRELQEFFSSKFPALGAHERHALTVSQRERLGAAGQEALWLAQENLSFSRKQIAPIVSQFFDPSGSR